MSSASEDPLARAIQLSLEFASKGGDRDVETFLIEHEPLREILEPLLRDEMEAEDDEPGPTVLGDFELRRELGRGGMGVVYEAVQVRLGRTVALKLLPPHRALSPRSLAMFRREAALAASLDHPGIARVLEFQEIDGQLALAMELIDGLPLDDVLEGLPKSSPSTLSGTDLARAAQVTGTGEEPPPAFRAGYEVTVVGWAKQVAEALAHAHSRGVVHRDVKPGNILLTPEGQAVLTDFGLAREDGMVGMTRTGEFAGTYQYAAPEQLEGRLDAIDGRTDVYALAATLYEMLTLQRPLEADSLTELFVLIKREDPLPPSRRNPRVSSDLDAVLLCALDKDPERRYASAAEFAIDLGHVLAGTPVKARRLSRPARVGRWVRRNPLVTAMVAVLLVSTIAVALFAASASRSLSRFNNLWVGAELDGLENRAAAAHPAWPSQSRELIQLRDLARKLVGMREAQAGVLADLRRGHLVEEAGARSRGRAPHPATARILELRDTAHRLSAQAKAPGVSEAMRSATAAEVMAMRAEAAHWESVVAASNRVAIDDPAERALHDRLEAQLYRLDRLESGLLADLEFRSDWAQRVAAETVDRAAAAWSAAAERVAADRRWGGFALAPQVGLVPLGPDPRSGLEEFGHPLSGAVPARDADGRLQLDASHGVVFVLLPPARDFTLPRWERGRDTRKRDWKVQLDPFLIAKHELSRAQWERLARGLPGLRWRDGGIADVRNHGELGKPVNGITWQMCHDLFRRYGFDLPTVMQWEYTAYFGGSWDATPASLAAVFNGKDQTYAAARRVPRTTALPFADGFAGLADVWTMQAIHSGVHHLFGNVSEWCRDVYSGAHVRPRDGDGLREGWSGRYVTRWFCGGHWQSTEAMPMSRQAADVAARSVGVRPVRTLTRWPVNEERPR